MKYIPTSSPTKLLLASCALCCLLTGASRAEIPDGVKGKNVTKVEHAAGSFSQIGPQRWKEVLGPKVGYFNEYARDEWSVYLAKDNGVQVFLDLYRQKIFLGPAESPKELYPITAASAGALPSPPPGPVIQENYRELISQVLGWGYDATGDFLHERYKRQNLFGITGRGDCVYIPMRGETDIEIKQGSTATSFSNSLSVNVKGGVNLGLFSTSVGFGVTNSRSGSNKTSFFELHDAIYLFKSHLPSAAQPTPQALADFNNPRVSPRTLIQKYGTHYIRFMEGGGAMMYRTFLEESERSHETHTETTVEAAYKIASGQSSVGTSNSKTVSTMNARARFFVNGGYADLNNRTRLDGNQYRDWKRAVWNKPALAGFGDHRIKDALVPIYELPGVVPARRNAIRTEFHRYLRESKGNTFNKPGVPLVKGNSRFTLKGMEGKWLGSAYSGNTGYYATAGSAGAVHQFDTGNSAALTGGQVVKIRISSGVSAERNYLALSRNDHELFYWWPKSQSYWVEWKIWKGSVGQGQGEPIRDGDTIVLVSKYSTSQCVKPSGSSPGYCTTSDGNYTWTIKLK